MIEKILPSNETKLRILKEVYENPNLSLTEIIKKVKASPNLVLEYLKLLSKFRVIKEERFGGKTKIHMKRVKPNLDSDLGISVFEWVEREKKLLLLEKYGELRPIAQQLEEMFVDNIEFCLVYGSFARLAASKDSDMDVLIVGNVDEELKKRLSEVFVTLKRKYSITVKSQADFLSEKDALHKNIVKEHVVIFGEKNFVKLRGMLDE